MRYKIELCKAIYSDYISLLQCIGYEYNFYEDCKIFPVNTFSIFSYLYHIGNSRTQTNEQNWRLVYHWNALVV